MEAKKLADFEKARLDLFIKPGLKTSFRFSCQ